MPLYSLVATSSDPIHYHSWSIPSIPKMLLFRETSSTWIMIEHDGNMTRDHPLHWSTRILEHCSFKKQPAEMKNHLGQLWSGKKQFRSHGQQSVCLRCYPLFLFDPAATSRKITVEIWPKRDLIKTRCVSFTNKQGIFHETPVRLAPCGRRGMQAVPFEPVTKKYKKAGNKNLPIFGKAYKKCFKSTSLCHTFVFIGGCDIPSLKVNDHTGNRNWPSFSFAKLWQSSI